MTTVNRETVLLAIQLRLAGYTFEPRAVLRAVSPRRGIPITVAYGHRGLVDVEVEDWTEDENGFHFSGTMPLFMPFACYPHALGSQLSSIDND